MNRKGRRPRTSPFPKEWLGLDDLRLSEWFEVGWAVKKRRVKHRDFERVRAIIREVKAKRKT